MFMATYDSGPLMLRAQVRHIDGLEPLASHRRVDAGGGRLRDLRGLRDDVHARQLEMYGGIDNAFDEQPPLLTSSWGGDANTDVTMYDVIGRRYFIGLRAQF